MWTTINEKVKALQFELNPLPPPNRVGSLLESQGDEKFVTLICRISSNLARTSSFFRTFWGGGAHVNAVWSRQQLLSTQRFEYRPTHTHTHTHTHTQTDRQATHMRMTFQCVEIVNKNQSLLIIFVDTLRAITLCVIALIHSDRTCTQTIQN